MSKSTKIKIFSILILIILVIIACQFNKQEISKLKISINRIEYVVESFGILGVLIYILIGSIRPFLFIPTTVLFISGGIIFGPIKGALYTLIGVMIATTLSFVVARKFQRFFKKILKNKYLAKLNNLNDKQIVKGLFIMRASPMFPFDPVSYGCGISNIQYEEFFLGTLLGSIPKVFIYAFLGSQIDNMFSLQTLLGFVILIVLAIILYIFHKKL